MPRPRPTLHVALLRGINVGGHKRIPMADLRALCGEIGWSADRSKLSPALLDRCVGSPVTTRNWRTVLALGGLIAAAATR